MIYGRIIAVIVHIVAVNILDTVAFRNVTVGVIGRVGVDVSVGVVRRGLVDIAVGVVRRGGVDIVVVIGVHRRGRVGGRGRHCGVIDIVVGVVVGVGARDGGCGRRVIIGVHQGL